MAVSAATLNSDFSGFLPATIAAPIFERATQMSVVQQLVRQVPLADNGTSVPVVTGRPAVGWVAEGAAKPASAGSLSLKTLTPKKMAAILVVSAEVVRANPGNYITLMRESLSEAFAIAFDKAALHDEGPDGTAGGGPFATFVAQTTKSVEIGAASQATGGVYKDLVNALSELVASQDASGRRYRLTGWALDTVLEPVILGATDNTGQPIFVYLPTDDTSAASQITAGRLLRRPSFMGEGVASDNLTSIVGFAGDWSQAAWGVVGGISFDVSTEASVTIGGALTSLWENNLVAIRAEAEYGFVVNDTAAFVELTNVGNSPETSA